MHSAASLSMTSSIRAVPGPVPLELEAACSALQLSDSMAVENVGCQTSSVDDQPYQESRESSDGSNMDWALDTINATAAKVSSLLQQIESVDPRAKGELLELIETLENSPDYRIAKEILMNGSPDPSIVRIDPLGGTILR